MAGFKALRDVSIKFGNDLRQQSASLFSAKVDENFEDIIMKKHADLSLLTSKLHLLQAKTLAALPEIKNADKDVDITVNDYTETAMAKIIEQQFVKILTQSEAVRKLVTTADEHLNPELRIRKEKIVAQAIEVCQREMTLRCLNNVLEKEESELLDARMEWDTVRGKLKMSQNVTNNEEQTNSPLHKKIQTLVDKMEQIRWLISKFVTANSKEYDWIIDPHKRLKALALTRQYHTKHSYTDM